MDEKTLARVIDEMAVRNVLARNMRGADRCDLELLRSTYWADATYSHIFTEGNAHEAAAFIIGMLKQKTTSSTHNMGSTVCEIDGDVACCETYVTNFIRLKDPGDDSSAVIITARMLDRLDRRDGEWRLSERKIVPEWEFNGAALAGEDALARFVGADRRSRDDDSYRLFEQRSFRPEGR